MKTGMHRCAFKLGRMPDTFVAPVIAILGPTGSGKSELALLVAEEFNGEVVNCDSLQIYRYFDIGTAKLSVPQRRGVPHHLIDIINPDQIFTAGEYVRQARSALSGISDRGRIPVIAGGTGFYLRALLEGLFPGPPREEKLRRRLAERQKVKPGSLHRLLRRFDPEAASKIHANDIPKVMRALEVCILTRRPITALFREGRDALPGYQPIKLGLFPPRDLLYDVLNRRCEQMFESGLLDEVEHILSMGFSARCKPFESHGYRQALQIRSGELTRKEGIFYAQRNTRHYAKRQMTWFRRERGLECFSGFGGDPHVQTGALDRIREYLLNFVRFGTIA